MNQNKGILLESGTNELEIVEFGIRENKFGINVIKVREIINPLPITSIPHAHPYVEGIIEIRGEILPVVNVAKVLGFPPSSNPKDDKYIVAEFNQMKVVFHVHSVTQIHRISWSQIEKPSNMYQGLESQITGVVNVKEDMILLIDLEKIVVEISPESGIQVEEVKKLGKRERSDKKIVIVEDSYLLRKLIVDTIREAGYTNLEYFENGEEALSYLNKTQELYGDLSEDVKLIITDIEMPKMDGHYLTKTIKENQMMSKVPVIIFSSLITEDLRYKGEQVKADAQISKPEIGRLIQVIDEIII